MSWSKWQRKVKGVGNSDMLGTGEPTTESEGEEVRLPNADVHCSQGKSSRRKQSKKAMKLKPAVAEIVAGISGTPSRTPRTKDKERREELAAAVIEKRRALVAKQFTSPIIGASNPAEQSAERVNPPGGEASQQRPFEDAGRTNVVDPGITDSNFFCSIRECHKKI